MKDKRETPEKHLIRQYKSYTLHDLGPVEGGDPGDHTLQICNDTGEQVHTLFFNGADPGSLNKAIERAKEWINENMERGGESASNEQPRYSDEDLEFFKGIIDKKIEGATKEVEYLRDLIKRKEDPDYQPGEADAAGDVTQLTLLVDRQEKFLVSLKEALSRIENKTYGICRVTGKLIDKARLTAVPHATLSIEAKANMGTKEPAKKTEVKKDKLKKEKTEKPKERTCRVCGCTTTNCQQCIEKTGKACHWVEQDLCSACVPEPEIIVTDNRASATEVEEKKEEPVIPEATNFFSQLLKFSRPGKLDLTLRLIEVEGKLQAGLFPAGKSKQKPIDIRGTAEEFDEGFFKSIIIAAKDIPGLISNIDDVKNEVSESGRKNDGTEPNSSASNHNDSSSATSKRKKWKRKTTVKKTSSVKPKKKDPMARKKPGQNSNVAAKKKPGPAPKKKIPSSKKLTEDLKKNAYKPKVPKTKSGPEKPKKPFKEKPAKETPAPAPEAPKLKSLFD